MTSPLAMITGASSGIGAATARALGRQGYRLVLVARRVERLSDLVAEIGPSARAESVDCGDGQAVLGMVDRVVNTVGVPDIVIHCAGAGQWKWIEDTSPADLDQMMAAPFGAAFHINHAVMPHMLARKSGLLVHVNSPISRLTWPGGTGYASARWALRGLHEALRMDLAGTGVRTSHVVFGEVSSEYFEANPDSRGRLPGIARAVPVMTPEQCAKVLVRVCRRPRNEVVRPLMLGLFYATANVAPWLVRWLLRTTGARR